MTLLLTLSIFAAALPIPAFADGTDAGSDTSAAAEIYETSGGFEDRNRMNDEEFFGKWNSETQAWELEPKLNYSYNSDMAIIGECVKQGDYDAGVFGTFTGLFNLAEIAGIELPDEFMDIYEKFALAEMNLTMPNGVQFGWGDGGPVQMRQRIYDAAEIIGNDYMYYFGTIGSEDQKGTVPDWTSYFMPESKLGVMRNNWSENGIAAFFRGRTGLSHSHADVNQMLLYAYGRYLLADTGMNSYDARDPWYTWQASRTESHNTVEINETGQEKSGNVYTTIISASFEGRVANIQTTQDVDLSEDYIMIYAPDVVKATLNDEAVEFKRMGGVRYRLYDRQQHMV